MSTQTAFYPTDPSWDLSVAPKSVLLNGSSPEFLSLSLLEKGNQHQHAGISSMQFPLNQTGMVQAVAPNMQDEGHETNRSPFHNRAPRSAPLDSCQELIDDEINEGPPLLHYHLFVPNLLGTTDNGAEFSFNNDCISPHPDLSSNKSLSPLQWQNGDTDKLAKHLKRNRVAASKSRKKKKQETNQLHNRFQEVSRGRSGLQDEIKVLQAQLFSLKDQIFMHSRCEDEAIQLYLGRMVKQATKHGALSSASTGLPNDDTFNYEHGSGSVSPWQGAMVGLREHPHPHATNCLN